MPASVFSSKSAALLIVAAALATGCGQKLASQKPGAQGQASGSLFPGLPGSNPEPGAPSVPSENAPSLPGDEASSASAPPIQAKINLRGYDGALSSQAIEVQAQKVLKVKFTPGIADRPAEGSNYTAPYSRLFVAITVDGRKQFTPLLANGLHGSERSHVMDLSSAFQKTCPADHPTCRQAVRITIGSANYDYWCWNYPVYCPQYPYTRVHESHWVSGTIEIQTDDTGQVK